MATAKERLATLETLLRAQHMIEDAIDAIDDRLALRPPKEERRTLLMRRSRLVVELDQVRRALNNIVARRGTIAPPSTELIASITTLADEVDRATAQSDQLEAAVNLTADVLDTVGQLDLG